jgi:CRP/FNR family cyclic AMP-dependent transcriptional regulator
MSVGAHDGGMLPKYDQWTERLSQLALFRGCRKKDLRVIDSLTTPITLGVGTVLCREGAPGDECFVVLDGVATVTIAGTPVKTVGPGGFVGELALLDGGPRVATVTAATDMELLVLTRTEFSLLLRDVPGMTRRVLEQVASMCRSEMEKLQPTPVTAG